MSFEYQGISWLPVLKTLAAVNMLGWLFAWDEKTRDYEILKIDIGLIEVFTPSSIVLAFLLLLEVGV